MSTEVLRLRLPVSSNRKTITSLNSLIQGLFHTPEWTETHLNLDLYSFSIQTKRVALDCEKGCQASSRSSDDSAASAVSEGAETRSMWFNDSPRNSFVELVDDDETYPPTSDSHSHTVLSPATNGSFYFGSEIISSLLSGTHSRSSSISYAPSDPSTKFAPPDIDCDRSVHSSEADMSLSDCLDDELLCSPLDSFAAICWNSAVRMDEHHAIFTTEEPEMQMEESLKTQETFDFYNPLQYDEYDDDSVEDEYSSGMNILSIEYNPVISEVAPWMHVPKKALSILDLRQDHTFLLKNHGSQNLTGSPSRAAFVPAIAGKCKRVMKSIKDLSA